MGLKLSSQVDVLFADRSFPDAPRCLGEAAPDLEIGLHGSLDETWQTPILVPLMSRIQGFDMDTLGGLRLIR